MTTAPSQRVYEFDRDVYLHEIDEETRRMTVTERLLEWSDWASGHRIVTGGGTTTIHRELRRRQIENGEAEEANIIEDRSSSVYDLTMRVEAVEKSVAHLRFEPNRYLKRVITGYYLGRMASLYIGTKIGFSEHHVEELRTRALRILAKEIPFWDQKLLTRAKSVG